MYTEFCTFGTRASVSGHGTNWSCVTALFTPIWAVISYPLLYDIASLFIWIIIDVMPSDASGMPKFHLILSISSHETLLLQMLLDYS